MNNFDLRENNAFDEYFYTPKSVMSKRMICKQAVFAIVPQITIFAQNAPSDTYNLQNVLTELDRNELLKYLTSYEKKLLLFETKEGVCAVLPTLYPSASLAIALFFDIAPSDFLRLIDACDAGDMFTISKNLAVHKSRLSKFIKMNIEPFSVLCKEIRESFWNFEDFNTNLLQLPYSQRFKRQCFGLSSFIGCPIMIDVDDNLEDVSFETFDFSLFTSFVVTSLMIARRYSEDRFAQINILEYNSLPMVSVSLKLYDSDVRLHFSKFKNIVYDKNMLFDISLNDGRAVVRLNPSRSEWSLLGLKQFTDFFDLSFS